jgi:hypothetical protein
VFAVVPAANAHGVLSNAWPDPDRATVFENGGSTMKPDAANLTAAIVLAALLAAAGPALAQESRWHPFIDFTPVYEGKGDLDQGGDFSVWRVNLNAGAVRNLGGGNSAGVALSYGYADYSFSSPAAFGGVAPWGIVQRYGVAIPLSFALRDGWSLGVIPSVDWFKENGADTGDSLVAGGIVSATKRFADGNRIGIGVGAYNGIERVPLPERRLAAERPLAHCQPPCCGSDRTRRARARLPLQ